MRAHLGTASTSKEARSILTYMLAFPAVIVIMLTCTTHMSLQLQFNSIVFGVVSWTSFWAAGTLCMVDPWRAIEMSVEAAFGLAPMVYLLVDFNPKYQKVESCAEDAILKAIWQEKVMTIVPVVLLAKSLLRTVIDMRTGRDPGTWHFYVDSLEAFTYIVHGLWFMRSFGQVWFLIYSGTPVLLASLWLDHMVLRVLTLNRANSRLMRTTFNGVIRVGATPENYKVLESSDDFDSLMGADATGRQLSEIFDARHHDLVQLCLPSLDHERKVRRMRTVLVGACESFQQDVELRALSATERELEKERGLTIGVVIMGERLPYSGTGASGPTTSLLLEQDFAASPASSDIMTPTQDFSRSVLKKSRLKCDETSSDAASISEINAFDSVSRIGRRRRRREQALSGGASSFSLSALDHNRCTAGPELYFKERSTCYAACWDVCDDKYIKECSQSYVEELLASWNLAHTSCCNWHHVVDSLRDHIVEMRGWKSCTDPWPTDKPEWQCRTCKAVHFNLDDGCWLCTSLREESSVVNDLQCEDEH